MKIRWTAESVRYRIEPEELESLLQGEAVEVSFAGVWKAVLKQGETSCLVTEGGEVHILLSPSETETLAQPEQEGVYFLQKTPPLRYYVEKDYPCAHPRASDAEERPTETFSPSQAFMERKAESG